MFVPDVEFEFLFRQSPTSTFLTAANTAVAARKIQIHSAELMVRRCKVDHEVYSALLTAAACSEAGEDGMEMDNTSTDTTSWSVPSTPWGQD